MRPLVDDVKAHLPDALWPIHVTGDEREVVLLVDQEAPPNVPDLKRHLVKRLAEHLTRAGFSCTRSRTRVSVMRPEDRAAPAREPDFACKR